MMMQNDHDKYATDYYCANFVFPTGRDWYWRCAESAVVPEKARTYIVEL